VAVQSKLLLLVAEENANFQQQREQKSPPQRARVGRGFERAAVVRKQRRKREKVESPLPVVGDFRS